MAMVVFTLSSFAGTVPSEAKTTENRTIVKVFDAPMYEVVTQDTLMEVMENKTDVIYLKTYSGTETASNWMYATEAKHWVYQYEPAPFCVQVMLETSPFYKSELSPNIGYLFSKGYKPIDQMKA